MPLATSTSIRSHPSQGFLPRPPSVPRHIAIGKSLPAHHCRLGKPVVSRRRKVLLPGGPGSGIKRNGVSYKGRPPRFFTKSTTPPHERGPDVVTLPSSPMWSFTATESPLDMAFTNTGCMAEPVRCPAGCPVPLSSPGSGPPTCITPRRTIYCRTAVFSTPIGSALVIRQNRSHFMRFPVLDRATAPNPTRNCTPLKMSFQNLRIGLMVLCKHIVVLDPAETMMYIAGNSFCTGGISQSVRFRTADTCASSEHTSTNTAKRRRGVCILNKDRNGNKDNMHQHITRASRYRLWWQTRALKTEHHKEHVEFLEVWDQHPQVG